MPVILTLIVLIGVFYAFWLFLQTATPYQTGRLLGVIAIILGVLGLFYLAISGRLPLALGLLIAAWPLLAGYFDRRRREILLQQRELNDENGFLKEKVKDDFKENS